MTHSAKLIFSGAALMIGFALLLISVASYLDGGTGRLPSAIAFGACGWMLLPVALAFGCRKAAAGVAVQVQGNNGVTDE